MNACARLDTRAIMFTSEGFPLMHESYKHDVMPSMEHIEEEIVM